MLKSFIVTSQAGKRLIGQGMVKHPAIQQVLKKGTLLILAGTTNGYVAEEILASIGQSEGFSRKGFCRGMTRPPGSKAKKGEFAGDVVIVDGQWQKGKEVSDVVDGMQAGDVILKGANAVNLSSRQAAVLIGHPKGGTIGASVPAVIGRRVRLIVPVGLEKRVVEDIAELAAAVNDPASAGPRLMPTPGKVFTELDAIVLLTGARGRLIGAGGVYGAEGACWIAAEGEPGQIEAAEKLLESVAREPPCEV